jgi:hypothetical protein
MVLLSAYVVAAAVSAIRSQRTTARSAAAV